MWRRKVLQWGMAGAELGGGWGGAGGRAAPPLARVCHETMDSVTPSDCQSAICKMKDKSYRGHGEVPSSSLIFGFHTNIKYIFVIFVTSAMLIIMYIYQECT